MFCQLEQFIQKIDPNLWTCPSFSKGHWHNISPMTVYITPADCVPVFFLLVPMVCARPWSVPDHCIAQIVTYQRLTLNVSDKLHSLFCCFFFHSSAESLVAVSLWTTIQRTFLAWLWLEDFLFLAMRLLSMALVIMAFVTVDPDKGVKLCIVHRHARPYMHDLGFYFKYLIRGIG